MNLIKRSLLALFMGIIFSVSLYAESPKREMRAAWVMTSWGLDWPSSSALNATAQKTELRAIIDKLHAANFNAVFLQVRGFCDAFYQSSYEPWSCYLTGTRGQSPEYDPLTYAIEYAHSLGMELHAWVNPYRYSSSSSNYGTLSSDYATTNPEWIMHNSTDNNQTILNPGIPEVREQIAKVVADIVTNYDVDGMLFDDYFYMSSGTQDSEDQTYYENNNPQGLSRADWRRDQINQMIELVYTTIKNIKPYVRFGVAPVGVACTSQDVATKYGVSACPVGSDWQYNVIYSEPLAWLKSQTIDYISPQLYWATTHSNQPFTELSNWWSSVAHTFGRHFYASHTLSELSSWGEQEYVNQVDANRQYTQNSAPGSAFYNISNGLNSATFMNSIKSGSFTNPACPPALTWYTVPTLSAPTDLTLNGSVLSWNHASAERFTVYAYTQGADQATALASSSNLVGVVYGKSLDVSNVADYASKTLAVCAYDRYGNEYEAAVYNMAETGNTPQYVTYELNGGVSDVAVDNQTLWERFMPDYNAYYNDNRGNQLLEGNGVASFMVKAQEMMTDTTSGWKWLGDYITKISVAQGAELVSEAYWRFAVQSFFMCNQRTAWPISADFTLHGQPAMWQPYYLMAIPPTKDGFAFGGWYDNAAFVGHKVTDIDSIKTGKMYARWVDPNAEEVPSTYTLSYVVDGEVVSSEDVQSGASIQPKEEPTKEGHTFSGWSTIPATMPENDVTITGSFTVNSYTLTYMLDGAVYSTEMVEFGTPLVAKEEPTKDGYVFSGWSGLPATMPAQDVTVWGVFPTMRYRVTFIVDGEIAGTDSVWVSMPIILPTEPTKEGYSFSGWQNAPEIMPEHDVTISGSFTINSYTLTYIVDGETISTETVEYGSPLVAKDAVTKEGYTFSGWSELPATMPAHDVTVSGTFSVNSYLLTYVLDGATISSDSVVFGTSLTLKPAPVKTGYRFMGWNPFITTMPAHDVTIVGSFEPILVTEVSLDVSQLDLFVGATHQLFVTILPKDALNKEIIWENSKPTVATVENGFVRAISRGQTTLTALSVETGYQAICVVTVQDDTALDDISSDATQGVHKVLENGTIYIIRNGEKYTIDGRKIK